jgi:hypothetical protein
MTYRQMAVIARCSTGAVGAEMRSWKKEQAIEEKIKQEMEEATAKITLDSGFDPAPVSTGEFQDIIFDFSQNMPKIEIELER